MHPYAQTREWNIFGWRKKNQSSAVPIGLLANKKSIYSIVENIMENLVLTFERFLMTSLGARSNIVIISQKKNLTSNRSKPIGLLTIIKASCSDERLPIGCLLPNFQQNWSNFFRHFFSHFFFSRSNRSKPIGVLTPKKRIFGEKH